MIDFSTLPAEVLHARGCYATVRSAHEDAKKELQMLCGQLAAASSQILRKMQPDHEAVPDSVEALIDTARVTLARMEACAVQIEALARQRADWKRQAWSKQ